MKRKKWKPTLVKLYKKNGDVFCGDKVPILEAIEQLTNEGYSKYFQGICYADNQTTLVGIDKNNKIDLAKRIENGLLNAIEVTI